MISAKNKRPITLEEVKRLLDVRIKEGDVTFEQQTSFDYAKKFSKLEITEVKKLDDELKEFINDPETRCKIIDILPKTEELLNVILQKKEITLSKDDFNKVLELCNTYRKKINK